MPDTTHNSRRAFGMFRAQPHAHGALRRYLHDASPSRCQMTCGCHELCRLPMLPATSDGIRHLLSLAPCAWHLASLLARCSAVCCQKPSVATSGVAPRRTTSTHEYLPACVVNIGDVARTSRACPQCPRPMPASPMHARLGLAAST